MKLPDKICCSAAELPGVIARVGRWTGASAAGRPMTEGALPAFADAAAVGRWIDILAGQASLEAEREKLPYSGFRNAVNRLAPLVVRITDSLQPTFIVLIGAVGNVLIAVDRNFEKVRLRGDVLRDFLFRRQRSDMLPEIERLLVYANVGSRRRRNSLQVLLENRLVAHRISDCWTLRRQGGANIWRHAQDVQLPGRFGRLLAAYAGAHFLWLASWWVLGRSALQGRFDAGWIAAWALLLLTMIPLRLFGTWMQGVTAAAAGWVCRQKLLHATLRLNPDEMRSYGIGHFLGRALELEAIETVGFGGGVLGIVALVELAAAALVLAMGTARVPELVVLLGWCGAVLVLVLCYLRRRRKWTGLRLEMTHDLTERIIGHRTSIAQESPERWHAGEDEMLETYLRASKKMDHIAAVLNAFGARGLVLLSMIALVPTVMNGSAPASSIAITLGGVLIGSEAIRKIVSSMMQIADTAIAWQRIQPLLAADADSSPTAGDFSITEPTGDDAQSRKLIECRDVRFQHRGRPQPVLQQCQLHIFAGDKLLLEGVSGSGKSSLVAVLAGLRHPNSGLLLLNGLDRQTLGLSGWRRKIAAAPQFHENHVFSETFAFNLLMGRRWPPWTEDMQEAEAVCNELGLGELLGRMPAGLMQMVGETGWQLSHGERSRMFIARALLQDAQLVVLDESFAALDPDTLRLCVDCVLRRSKTLLVVAHP